MIKYCLPILLVSLLPFLPVSAEVHSLPAPIIYTVCDGDAKLVLGIQDNKLLHVAMVNRLTRYVRPLLSREFAIELDQGELGPDDFTVQKVEQDGPGKLKVSLTADAAPVELEVFYYEEPGSFFIRKWIRVLPREGRSIFLKRVLLTDFEPWKEPKTFSGPGQPVYVAATFWGVEYPAAENAVKDGRVVCEYKVGLEIGAEGYESYPLVFGVSEEARVHERFLKYIDIIRSSPVRPFLLYNTWYDLRDYSADQVVSSVQGFRDKLVNRYGIKLDSVVLDDGWDNYRKLWTPNRKRFPEGFTPVVSAGQDVGARLGLWMSPLGGYPQRQFYRLWATLGQGFERSAKGFCIAGRKYHEWFKDRMVQYVKEDKVNYFKLDNLTTSCNNAAHGHRVGQYNQVGLTDAFIDVMEAVKKQDRAVMINITVGSWLSPWWLKYCDVVWRGGADYQFAGQGSRRQQSITYVDSVLYKKFIEEGVQFPLNSVMTHGVVKGRHQNFGEDRENLRDFSDDVWMYFSRGVAMQELYLTPDLLSEREWEVLAQAIKFSRDNFDVLSQAEMVLGNPGKGEIYGFLCCGEDRVILALRNPAEKEQSIGVDWKALLGQDLFARFSSAKLIYSAFADSPEKARIDKGDAAITMQSLETRVLNFIFSSRVRSGGTAM